MARSTDQSQVIPLAGRLIDGRAFRGAAVILFNAALQRQAADRGDRLEWTPWGPIPVRRQAQPHLHALNDDHPEAPSPTA